MTGISITSLNGTEGMLSAQWTVRAPSYGSGLEGGWWGITTNPQCIKSLQCGPGYVACLVLSTLESLVREGYVCNP